MQPVAVAVVPNLGQKSDPTGLRRSSGNCDLVPIRFIGFDTTYAWCIMKPILEFLEQGKPNPL